MKKDNFFPIFVDFSKKEILVIGGGKIAYRKIVTLLNRGTNITIITKQIKAKEITELLFNEKRVQLIMKELSSSSLEEFLTNRFFLVVAATDNQELNSDIVEVCQRKNILVNNTTSTYDMNTRFCSIIDEEKYSIGISAKGNPKLSMLLKEKICNFLKLKGDIDESKFS